jgi:hypothetical protein
MAVPAVAIIFVLWSDERYYFVYIPFMSIWAANGVWEFGRWARATSAAARWSFLKRPFMSRYVVPALAVLAVVALPAHQIQKLFVFSDSARAARPDKLAGQWIGSLQNRSIRIMDLSLPLSFHAGAQQHVYFPYCDADQAIRYLDAAQIDYVVLRRDREFTKYYAAWLSSAIPDQRAELLQLPPDIHDENLIVYRWHWREGASQVHP